MEFITKSAKETEKVGQKVADLILEGKIASKKAVVLCLVGDLGSGKTTFTKGFAFRLGLKKRILSPTFILAREYDLNRKTPFKELIHIDLYRMEGENIKEELQGIGFSDIYADPKNIVVIEWADKAKAFLQNKGIWVKFKQETADKREITLQLV